MNSELEEISILLMEGNFSEVKKDIHRVVILTYNTLYYRVKNNQIEIISFFSNRQNPKKRMLK